MFEDEIVGEVRKAREDYAAKFNYDLDQIFKDVKKRQEKSGHKLVRTTRKLKSREVKPRH